MEIDKKQSSITDRNSCDAALSFWGVCYYLSFLLLNDSGLYCNLGE